MAVQWMESLDHKPTALIGGIFRSAIGAIEQYRNMGINVPTHRSVIGIGDREWCKFINPPLTNISNSLSLMGHWAAQRLIDRIENHKDKSQNIHQVFVPEIILRESSGPCCD